MISSLKLISNRGDVVPLRVFRGQWTFRVEDILNAQVNVYEDRRYKIQVDVDEDVDTVLLYLNEEIETGNRDGNSVVFEESEYFKNQIGFAQITLEAVNKNSDENELYYTEFASILISSTKNQAVSAMLQYIYDNQAIALTRSQQSSAINRDNQIVFEDLESQLQLLEEIISVYENNYGFFKANSRTKLIPTETIDRIEKLRYIGPKTLAYIAQHPELMKPEASGIKHGKTSFLPSRTLMIKEAVTNDIYENQVVQSFLEYALRDGKTLVDQIDDLLHLIQRKGVDRTENGYIISCSLLFINAKEILLEYRERIVRINSRLSISYVAYSQILKVSKVDLSIQPKPTPVFLGVPQYNQIYSCIIRWFGKSGYNFRKERNMLNYFKISTVYEVYTLIRLINALLKQGYDLDETRIINYTMGSDPFKPKEYSNYYRFTKRDNTIVLYYEPVVYNDYTNQNNGLNIYRNNTTSYEGSKGNYYTPDYILVKIDNNGNENYIIADAKYDFPGHVRKKLIPELSYKYLVSVSPLIHKAYVLGMDVICGLPDYFSNNKTKTFYDRETGIKVVPFIDLVPLSAMMVESEQENNVKELLGRLL